MRRALVAAAVIAAAAAIAVRAPLGVDYGNLGCHLHSPRCDEAAYPIDALAHLHLATFVHEQTLMGPVSLVLRAPFTAVANAFDADLLSLYRVGLFACMLASGFLAVALWRRSLAHGHSRLQAACVAVLTFVSPVVYNAIDAGHPEELLAAAVAVASAVWAIEQRWALAGIALGLAIATKPWALLIALPVFLVIEPRGRRRFAAIGAVVLLLFYVPLIAADPGRFRTVTREAGTLGSHFGEATPANAWFFATDVGTFSSPSEVRNGKLIFGQSSGYAVPASDARIAHALVVVLALAMTLVWYRRGGPQAPETVLLLIAAILIVRCALDPGNHSYYHAPAAVALLAYAAMRPKAAFPWLAFAFIGGLWVVTRVNGHLHTDTAFALVYLAFALPALALVGGLALNPCRRSRSTRLIQP